MDWAWNPDSVAAVGTAAATMFAGLAALLAVLDLARRRRADTRQQAALIGAWTVVDYDAFDPQTGEGIVCRLHVNNRSDLPIFNLVVTCDARLGKSDQPTFRWHSLGPGQELTKEVWQTSAHDALGYPGQVVSYSFSDHASRKWSRNGDGLLTALD
ncbi:hypothetical protein [Serinicoccus sp. CUA-874]|uniref:hypothetical protein n=1 Tax=Serinicoccus sp. CUA-874 TaxID=1517939 RepID=UPI001179D5AC|nr:hypothetical protein [Serinicoccus sp. CUA-874]